MNCGCANRQMSMEKERIRRLAKAYAVMEGCNAVVIRNADGTYGFCKESEQTDKETIEIITPY